MFYKTEVQTVLLRCSTCQNLNWIQSYDRKHKSFHFFFFYHFVKQKAEHLCLINGHFKTISGQFLPATFHKTEDQMVILRCLTCLNLYWNKSYDILLVKIFFFHAWKCMISGVLCEVSFLSSEQNQLSYFPDGFYRDLIYLPHFKDFDMMHLK